MSVALKESPTSLAPKAQALGRARVTVFANTKGGVGKTTDAVNVAGMLARGVFALRGDEFKPLTPPQRVLFIDTEQHNTGSSWLGVRVSDPKLSSAVLFEREWDDPNVVLGLIQPAKREPFDIIPSHYSALDRVDRDPALSDYTFAHNIEHLRPHYDHIIIDTPGNNVHRLVAGPLIAADGLVMPIKPDAKVFDSMEQFVELIYRIKKGPNPELHIDGWLISNAGSKGDADALALQADLQGSGQYIFQTRIRTLKAIQRSAGADVTVFEMADNHEAVLDFMMFGAEWITRIGRNAR